MQHWRAMREECIGFSPVRLDYQGWRNVFVISVPGASYGALAAWRGNLRANISVHAWGDVWEGWLKFVVWR